MNEDKKQQFIKEVATTINCLSLENNSDTPDFVIAEYLWNCLQTWNDAVRAREQHDNTYYEHVPLTSERTIPTRYKYAGQLAAREYNKVQDVED
jgi:hypothetical protein